MYLHWILALMATLLHCFTANPINPNTFTDIKTTIKRLKTQSCNETDSTFYSPSGDCGCAIQALNCTIEELNVVESECFVPKTNNTLFVRKLQEHIKTMLNTVQGDSKSCPCEEEPKGSYKEFLDNTLTLVQKVYSHQNKC